jgi:hypothetical protein
MKNERPKLVQVFAVCGAAVPIHNQAIAILKMLRAAGRAAAGPCLAENARRRAQQKPGGGGHLPRVWLADGVGSPQLIYTT